MSYFACVKFDVIKSKVSVFRSSGTKSEATHTQFRRCWHKYNDHVMSVSRVVSTLDITRFPSSFDPRLFLVNPFVGPALPPVTIYPYPLIDFATRLVIKFSLSLKHIRGTSFLFSLLPQRFTPFSAHLHLFSFRCHNISYTQRLSCNIRFLNATIFSVSLTVPLPPNKHDTA